jgi:hypothetical protein
MIKSELKQKMISAIEAKVGFKIRTLFDAQQLAEIMLASSIAISTHTIARFFGVIKPERKHYRYTLNLLSNFLGYKDYYDWEQYNSNNNKLGNRLLLGNDFPLQELELFLISDAIGDIESILKKYSLAEVEPYRFVVSSILGFYVRNSGRQKELLTLLSKYELGRSLYYETYVDEDNQHLFFSKALKELYLPEKPEIGKILFANSFYDTQQIYSGNQPEIDKNLLAIDRKSIQLHTHELSRFWEYYFLVKIPQLNKRELLKRIDELLIDTENNNLEAISWILSRPIRAFAFHQQLEILKKHDQFMECCLNILKNQGEFLDSMAALLIQTLIITEPAYKSQLFGIKTTPSLDFTNESHNKVLLENISKYYLHKDILGDNYRQKIISAGKYLGKNWVSGFLKD